MTERYREVLFTPAVRAAQERQGSAAAYAAREVPEEPDRLGPDEAAFILARDSFYMATVGTRGWPYVQHRGGAPGFVQVLGPDRIGFADLRGNRQYISLGNLAEDDRVSLFFMDYPRRARLKLLGRVRVVAPEAAPDVMATVTDPRLQLRVERVMVVTVEAFDWNCPQYITPRWTREEIAPAIESLQGRIAELEAELARLRP